jgi:Phage tail protein (Tail_P2_I).
VTMRDRIGLRFWQDGGQLARIGKAADLWFDKITDYLSWLNRQIDADTAPLELLDLLAWQRDIDRLPGEDEDLYRRRVKYALVNAKDAGSKRGFERIWNRLGLGEIRQTERFDSENWDVIRLQIDEYVFGKYVGLFDTLLEQYGRTCRRYVFESQAVTPAEIRAAGFECEVFHNTARAE